MSVAGGGVDIVTVAGADETTFAVAVANESGFVVDFAVIVTVPLEGAEEGAV